ncbi:hypothetical protein [Rhodohalobacter sp. 8-1]|uniref:hypothetical protein n=1 Tax=Rhodohalobacter sp. 8-1 TaxID=3131972 RepID=UPI0030EE5C0A
MIIKLKNILFKLTAKLLILASMLCVLFGNGTHIHTVFDHISDHSDVHVFVHSHSGDHSQGHNHTSNFDDIGTHHHPTASVDLVGTMSQKTTITSFDYSDVISAAGGLSSLSISETPIPLFLDLPPPDDLYKSWHVSSNSLRGPPLG